MIVFFCISMLRDFFLCTIVTLIMLTILVDIHNLHAERLVNVMNIKSKPSSFEN